MQRRLTLRALASVPLALGVGRGYAQPGDKPLRIVVPFPPGNTLDAALRHVIEVFKKNTGRTLLIDNKPGGSGVIAAQNVAQAAPDGNTLLLTNSSILTINPLIFARLPYDAEKAFRPVSNFLGASMVLAVNSGVPASNVEEFVAWAKSYPGNVSFASFAMGGAPHFACVILNQRAGLNMTMVPYNGTPPVVQNLAGGQVHASFLPLIAVKPHLESGRIKVLAVTSPQRSPLMPQVPTFREQGYPDLEIYIWSAIAAPAATPDAVVDRLNHDFVQALKSPEVREKWQAMDFEPLPSTPQEFTRFAQADAKRWVEAVKLSGFKASE